MHSQKWCAKLCDSRETINYRSIVFTFISRDYLKVVFNARHGTAMTRLRIRNNRFYVETDSWYNNSVP